MPKTPDDILNSIERNEELKRLVKLYTAGVLLIEKEHRKALKENFDREEIEDEVALITEDLDAGTTEWIEQNYAPLYAAAAIAAREVLKKDVDSSINVNAPFEDVDNQTLQSSALATKNLLSEALSGVRRKTSTMLDAVTQERIQAELARKTGETFTRKEVTESIIGILEQAGVGSLTDRSGKVWQLDTYAEMVTKTEYTNLVNNATRTQALKEGQDLVQFTTHGATDSCGPLEGVIVSLTGKTPGFERLDVAISGTHMLGPNCKHTYNPISVEEALAS